MLDIVEEQKNLIEKLVKSNPRFAGNEDLFEDFCNETFERSCHIAKNLKDINALENYLKKVVQSSILTVLRNMGRIRRLNGSYTGSKKEIPMSAISSSPDNSTNIEEKILSENFSYDISEKYISAEDIMISKTLLKNVVDIVFKQDVQEPEKKYLDIFKLRYKEGKKQSQIAEELGLSQSEISKRLVEISKFVKKQIEN